MQKVCSAPHIASFCRRFCDSHTYLYIDCESYILETDGESLCDWEFYITFVEVLEAIEHF